MAEDGRKVCGKGAKLKHNCGKVWWRKVFNTVKQQLWESAVAEERRKVGGKGAKQDNYMIAALHVVFANDHMAASQKSGCTSYKRTVVLFIPLNYTLI